MEQSYWSSERKRNLFVYSTSKLRIKLKINVMVIQRMTRRSMTSVISMITLPLLIVTLIRRTTRISAAAALLNIKYTLIRYVALMIILYYDVFSPKYTTTCFKVVFALILFFFPTIFEALLLGSTAFVSVLTHPRIRAGKSSIIHRFSF